eukprot:4837714-Pyramimonas_sp.AAC.2
MLCPPLAKGWRCVSLTRQQQPHNTTHNSREDDSRGPCDSVLEGTDHTHCVPSPRTTSYNI